MADTEQRRVKLTDIAFGGECLARLDNQVLFASYGLPGEEVTVEIEQGKKDYRRGRVVEVIAPSPARVEPRCPLFGRCGGCQWQHIAYSSQLELKRKVVADQLRRIGSFGDRIPVNPTLSADQPWHYRNHGRFSVRDGQLGFLEEGSHRFLPVAQCYLMHPAIEEAAATLRGKLDEGMQQVSIRYGVNTGQLLFSPTVRGQGSFEESILGRRFRIAAEAFFQVNTAQAERLISYALDRLDLREDGTLLDIYCGVGVFGLLAADKVGSVIGIESSAAAVRDARYNARGMSNVRYIKGEAEWVMATLQEKVSAAIIDPPRAGCKRQVVKALLRLRPRRLVYVSCDPATLARDLKLLCADGAYDILDVQPVDMFPQTYHVETVATLQAR